ncbi:MAG: site-specific integrase [Planctomycetota bacterium]
MDGTWTRPIMAKHTRRQIPKLSFTEAQGIGYHASYRDPVTNTPRRKRFGMVTEAEARVVYSRWLAEHMGGLAAPPAKPSPTRKAEAAATTPPPSVVSTPTEGSLLAVADSLLRQEERRIRPEGAARSPGSITRQTYLDRKHCLRSFLQHLNDRQGQGAVAKMTLHDLTMIDVEAFNQASVDAGMSRSLVAKRMQMVKALINRAGRPEFGCQVLGWNWDAMDRQHGKASEGRTLPTLAQLQSLLRAADLRGQTLLWMAIGLGFGQRDLSAVRVGQIDERSYDLRRGKTGVERYGETPALVWSMIKAYLAKHHRQTGALMFTTRKGMPLVHGRSDSIVQWWGKLREQIGETPASLGGFYTLRHVGATEFGSRDGTSIGAMKRWLGHSASSSMADVYMRPVAPEQRELIEWVRDCLASSAPPALPPET